MADSEARADLPASFVQRFRRKQAQQERPPVRSRFRPGLRPVARPRPPALRLRGLT